MWKEVTRNTMDIKKHKDKSYIGTYLDSEQIQTKIGQQVIYKFEGEEGEKFSIYGFTNLNRAMDSISEGALVKITYLGMTNVETKFGKKDVHQVRVEVDMEEGEG